MNTLTSQLERLSDLGHRQCMESQTQLRSLHLYRILVATIKWYREDFLNCLEKERWVGME